MRQLLQLEREGWQALAAGTAVEFYGSLLTEDAAMVVPGAVLDRQQTLDSWRTVPPWRDYEISDERVVMLRDDVGLVTYRAVARRDQGQVYQGQFTSVYVGRNGDWRLVFHQQTPQP